MANEDDKDGFRNIPPDNFETIEDLEYRLGNLDSTNRTEEAGFLVAIFGAIALITAVIIWLTLRS